MVEPVVWQSLITASSGLIGSLIGFGGSWVVSRRAERIAQTQVIHTKSYERREEVLSSLYQKFSHLDEAIFISLLPTIERAPADDLEARVATRHEALGLADQIADDLQDLLFYRERHSIWFSARMLGQTYKLFNAYRTVFRQHCLPTLSEANEPRRQQLVAEAQAKRDDLYAELHRLRADVREVLSIVD